MDLRSAALDLLKKNRRKTGEHQYTIPSPDIYPYQWLWDSCFHIVMLAKLEPEAAKAELRSLISKQFKSGMLPHIIYWEQGPLHNYEWGAEGTSALTQPPLIAYAAWEVHRHTADHAFLSEVYPALLTYYRYLISERDPRDHHLAGIINPDESGEDTSPRFDSLLKVPPDISLADHLKRRLELVDANRVCNFDASLCMSRHFWVKDVLFNTLLVKNLNILSQIAALVGREEDQRFCSLHAGLVRDAMRDKLFENGVFYSASAFESKYELLKVETWIHFVPLFAELYTPGEARAVIDTHLMNPETFWSPFGIRTVSRKEPSYRPVPEGPIDVHDGGFWRGPVWLAPHWFIYRGLKSYGFSKEADAIRSASVELVEKSGFREYYHPETGEGYGAHDFTWGTLVLDMIES